MGASFALTLRAARSTDQRRPPPVAENAGDCRSAAAIPHAGPMPQSPHRQNRGGGPEPWRHLTFAPPAVRPGVQGQDTVCIRGQQAIQPGIQAVGPLCASSPAQLANALRHFSNGNRRQKQRLVVRLQPLAQGGRHERFPPWCQRGHHAGVQQIPLIQNRFPAAA